MHFSAQSSATQQRGNIVDWLHSRNSLEQGARKRLQWRVTNYLGSTQRLRASASPFRPSHTEQRPESYWIPAANCKKVPFSSNFL